MRSRPERNSAAGSPMVFSSTLFLFAFLPAFLTVYGVAPQRLRNFIALVGSLAFYAWGAPWFVFVLVGATAVDYWISRAIVNVDRRVGRRLVTVSVSLNVAMLAFFKYANFFVDQVNALIASAGGDPFGWTEVLLPIGVSFFTFQKISYVVDVYRRVSPPARSMSDCLLYVALFPQLIAGPIVRYHDIQRQITSRVHSGDRFVSGVFRFTLGLAKKVLIANTLASVVDALYAFDGSELPVGYAWLAAFCYYFQIYFDFSGYSDMAIGLGRMMGFELLENFDRPYTARTMTEFWRRWHISLSSWMREYLYVPLGGNRVAKWRTFANLWCVFLFSGLWHGAAWTFVVWGAIQGVFLTLDRLFFLRWAERIPDVLLRVAMVVSVALAFVVFRAEDLPQAMSFFARMFSAEGPDALTSPASLELRFGNYELFVLGLAAAIAFGPWFGWFVTAERHLLQWRRSTFREAFCASAVLMLFALTVVALVNSAHNPFIYFRF